MGTKVIALARMYAVSLVLGLLVLQMSNQAGQQVRQQPPEQVAGHDVLRVISVPAHFVPPPNFIFADRAGLIWFGAGLYTFLYDEANRWWEDRTEAFGKKQSIWPLVAAGEDGRGRLWVEYGLSGQLAFYANGKWHRASEICPPEIRSLGHTLIPGKDGRIWLVSLAGLLDYDGAHWNGPFNPTQAALGQGGSSSTAGGRSPKPKSVYNRDAFDEAAKWIAGFWNGVEDSDGEVWLSGERAIWRFDPKTGSWKFYSVIYPQAMSQSRVLQDNSTAVWFWETTGHVARYDKLADRWARYDISGRLTKMGARIEVLWPDRPGRVIIGTSEGNFALTESSGELTPMALQASGEDLHGESGISAVAEDRQGGIWVAWSDKIFVLRQ